jgi:hypothetical protein
VLWYACGLGSAFPGCAGRKRGALRCPCRREAALKGLEVSVFWTPLFGGNASPASTRTGAEIPPLGCACGLCFPWSVRLRLVLGRGAGYGQGKSQGVPHASEEDVPPGGVSMVRTGRLLRCAGAPAFVRGKRGGRRPPAGASLAAATVSGGWWRGVGPFDGPCLAAGRFRRGVAHDLGGGSCLGRGAERFSFLGGHRLAASPASRAPLFGEPCPRPAGAPAGTSLCRGVWPLALDRHGGCHGCGRFLACPLGRRADVSRPRLGSVSGAAGA